MPPIAWDEKLIMGIEIMDDHHRQLVDLINRVDYVLAAGASRETIAAVVDVLIDYATYHFASEEHLMTMHADPSFRGHKQAHDLFIARVVDYDRGLADGKDIPLPEISAFLQGWLTGHILQTDAHTAAFLRERGVK